MDKEELINTLEMYHVSNTMISDLEAAEKILDESGYCTIGTSVCNAIGVLKKIKSKQQQIIEYMEFDQDLHAMIWAIDARLHCTYMKDGEPADAVVSFEISRWFLEEIHEKLNELMKIKQSVKFKELVDDASAEGACADAGGDP